MKGTVSIDNKTMDRDPTAKITVVTVGIAVIAVIATKIEGQTNMATERKVVTPTKTKVATDKIVVPGRKVKKGSQATSTKIIDHTTTAIRNLAITRNALTSLKSTPTQTTDNSIVMTPNSS